MAWSDPTVITNAGTAISLNKLGNGANGTNILSSTDGNDEVLIRHTRPKSGLLRNNIQYKRTKLIADPYLTGVSRDVDLRVNLTVEANKNFTVTERKDAALALTTLLTASSNALLLKLLGFEL